MKHFITRLLLSSILFISLSSSLAIPVIANAESLNTTAPVDISVTPVQGPSSTKMLASRAAHTWPWYITRAAGFVASGLLVLLILSGIGLVTGYTFRFFEPLTAWAVHKAIGVSFGIALAIHIVVLLFDTYAPFSIAAVLFPFVSNYQPITFYGIHLGSFFVALGVFALYGVIVIMLSSYIWIDKKPKRWKLLHLLSYLVAVCAYFHALYLGTDLVHGTLRTLWIALGIFVLIAIIYRIKRAGSV